MKPIPVFAPRIFYAQGGAFFEDGRVRGAIEEGEGEGEGARTLVIHEWSSYFPGRGHTKQSLQWLRCQGFRHIVANGVGMLDDGACGGAAAYWMHLQSLQLVDVLLDDEGNEVTLAK